MDTADPSLGRRPGARWRTVTRGAHLPASAPLGLPTDLVAWQAVLPPEAVFTHLTAAALRAWWLPPVPAWLPVFVALPADRPRPRRPGLHVTRLRRPVAVWERAGLRLASPAETLLACARDLGLLDIVVMVDSALAAGQVTRADLAATATGGRAGAPLLRSAVALADARSESPWETLMRVLHTTLGVEVEPQHEVRTPAGLFVARGDLWLTGTTTLHEYDGAHHLTRDQQHLDLDRARRLVNLGWTRRGYTATDLVRHPVRVVEDIELSLGIRIPRERLATWRSLLADSLFTSQGARRLARRLGRTSGQLVRAPAARNPQK
ncbi:MAG: hypothetical protein ACXVWU_10535 [Nocardioides sp.]